MRISGIFQKTPTMVYNLRPLHLYTYISQLYLSSHFSKSNNLFTTEYNDATHNLNRQGKVYRIKLLNDWKELFIK